MKKLRVAVVALWAIFGKRGLSPFLAALNSRAARDSSMALKRSAGRHFAEAS
jgi:hypothetical protein